MPRPYRPAPFELESEDDDGTPWFSSPQSATEGPASRAFLIPMYDELGVAYKDLRMVLAEQPPREGLLERPIVIDGETVGSLEADAHKPVSHDSRDPVHVPERRAGGGARRRGGALRGVRGAASGARAQPSLT